MMRVHCTVNKKRVLETSNDNDSRKKQANESENIVDLTKDNTVNDDEAYARLLYQEEIEAAALRSAPRAENVVSLAQPSFATSSRVKEERDPTLVNAGQGEPWLFVSGPGSSVDVLGKWLVFLRKTTNEVW